MVFKDSFYLFSLNKTHFFHGIHCFSIFLIHGFRWFLYHVYLRLHVFHWLLIVSTCLSLVFIGFCIRFLQGVHLFLHVVHWLCVSIAFIDFPSFLQEVIWSLLILPDTSAKSKWRTVVSCFTVQTPQTTLPGAFWSNLCPTGHFVILKGHVTDVSTHIKMKYPWNDPSVPRNDPWDTDLTNYGTG